MKAVAVLEPGKSWKIACVDIPKPVFGDYECLVQVKACGICSSTDLKIVHGEHPDVPGFPFIYPTILGHEAVGEIIDIGKKVRYLKAGDRVVNPITIHNLPECGYHMHYGGMTEYSIAPDIKALEEDGVDSLFLKMAPEPVDFLTKVFPDDISYVDAVMILTFKENYSALRNFGITEGMDVIVFGDGAVSMGLSLFLKAAYKAHSVVVVGHHDERLEKIKKIASPDLLINAHKETIENVLGDRKFDLAIDAAGSIEIVKQGAALLKSGGKVGIYGVLKKGHSVLDIYEVPNCISFQTLTLPYKEHRTHDDIVDFIHKGLVKPSDFYSHVLPVEQAAEGIRLLEKREAFKVILTF
jgi:L-iditol 2-dehydrogenase